MSSKPSNEIAQFKKRYKAKSRENLEAAAQEWHAGIMQVMTGSRTGRQYKVPGTKRVYTASAPGEAPANRTGVLRAKYRFRAENDTTAVVGNPDPVALYLDQGNKRGNRMAARPHIKPGYEYNKSRIQAALRRKY